MTYRLYSHCQIISLETWKRNAFQLAFRTAVAWDERLWVVDEITTEEVRQRFHTEHKRVGVML